MPKRIAYSAAETLRFGIEETIAPDSTNIRSRVFVDMTHIIWDRVLAKLTTSRFTRLQARGMVMLVPNDRSEPRLIFQPSAPDTTSPPPRERAVHQIHLLNILLLGTPDDERDPLLRVMMSYKPPSEQADYPMKARLTLPIDFETKAATKLAVDRMKRQSSEMELRPSKYMAVVQKGSLPVSVRVTTAVDLRTQGWQKAEGQPGYRTAEFTGRGLRSPQQEIVAFTGLVSLAHTARQQADFRSAARS